MFFILLYCADKMGLLMVRNSPTAKEETINAHILPSAEKWASDLLKMMHIPI